MGLDLVEMVMAVETEFGLAIPDEEASGLETPGLLHAYVCRRLAEMPATCPSQAAFHRLRRGLAQFGVERSAVRLDAPVAGLLEVTPSAWAALAGAVGLRLPRLVRSARSETGLALGALAWVGAAALLERSALVLAGAPLVWGLARAGSASWATHLPAACRDVRGLVVEIRALSDLAGRDRRWTSEEVWERLVRIIVEQLGVDERLVTRDVEFVRDLGAG